MDELDIKEKDSIKYDKVEMKQKDLSQMADTETKESGSSKVEEARRYGLFCLCSRDFVWLVLQANL